MRLFGMVEASEGQGYTPAMSIELPCDVEEQLRTLAARQGRGVNILVEEAIQQYLETAAITDVDEGEVAETQDALLAELQDIADWKADGA